MRGTNTLGPISEIQRTALGLAKLASGDPAGAADVLTAAARDARAKGHEAIFVDASVALTGALLAGKHQGAVLVVDDEGKLIGIFSERDVLYRVVGSDRDVNSTTVGEVMTPDPVALSASSKIAAAPAQSPSSILDLISDAASPASSPSSGLSSMRLNSKSRSSSAMGAPYPPGCPSWSPLANCRHARPRTALRARARPRR